MSRQVRQTLDVPYRDVLLKENGLLSQPWEWFFRAVRERLTPLGEEKSAVILNAQGAPKDLIDLKYDERSVSSAAIDYLIQRVTSGANGTRLVEAGTLIAVYLPNNSTVNNSTWAIFKSGSSGPDNAGVTFSITNSGQVRYISTDITGEHVISKMFWRVRTISGKNINYSVVGR